jgi:hypothetical protein
MGTHLRETTGGLSGNFGLAFKFLSKQRAACKPAQPAPWCYGLYRELEDETSEAKKRDLGECI